MWPSAGWKRNFTPAEWLKWLGNTNGRRNVLHTNNLVGPGSPGRRDASSETRRRSLDRIAGRRPWLLQPGPLANGVGPAAQRENPFQSRMASSVAAMTSELDARRCTVHAPLARLPAPGLARRHAQQAFSCPFPPLRFTPHSPRRYSMILCICVPSFCLQPSFVSLHADAPALLA
jgi:hypothetical protein